jgi:hypothetical protein
VKYTDMIKRAGSVISTDPIFVIMIKKEANATGRKCVTFSMT